MPISSRKRRHDAGRRGISLLQRHAAVVVDRLEERRLFSASWTALAHAAPGGIHNMLLLGNGDVMAELGGSQNWALLTPSSTGSYVNGTWSYLSNMHDTRTYYSSQVLPNGSVFVAGGEYGTGGATAEVYNPTTNTWTLAPTGVGSYIDAMSEILPNGMVLESPVYPASSGYTYLYNYSSNTWTTAAKMYRGSDSDEQNWVKLGDGSILAPDGSFTSERYIPSLNQWINDATSTIKFNDSLGEFGQGVLLPNGNAFYIGTGSTTEIYTPSGNTTPGTWSAGPTLASTLGTDDAPAAVLPDGNVLFACGPIDSYSTPTTLEIYNCQTNTLSPVVAGPNLSGVAYGDRFLDLPDGTVLMTNGGSTLYDYNDGGTAIAAAAPTITNIVHNTNGSYTLTGTQLNGNSEGAYYGDDAQMNSNYPMVRLTSSTGTVYFANSYGWSTTNVDTGATPESTNFSLPLGLPTGTYTVNVMVNGFISANSSITVATGTAPTVATAAAATPSPTGLTTTALSVLGASGNGESTLTYTWVNTSAPSGQSTASFSINGTNAAKNTTVTFQQAGTYTFKVYITDANGLSTTSSVTVVVNQTLSSIAFTPATNSLSAGATQQLTAIGYDQFANTMTTQPKFSYSMNSGTGSVTTYGLYIAPSTGTRATVKAATGSFTAYATLGVVDNPWSSADVGSVGVVGTAYSSAGTFTVVGSGGDIWGTSDAFHYVYKQFTGDMTITAEVLTDPNTGNAKAGVMIRNSLASNDQYVDVSLTPSKAIDMEYRSVSGGSAAVATDSSGFNIPYWVRISRVGNTFTGYRSTNGTTWTQYGTCTIAMGTAVYVGIEEDSGNNSVTDTATFSNLSVTQPANTAPTVATAATATAVQGYSSDLSILGADDAGEPNLTYTWTATTLPSGAAQPTYSVNGTNAAKSAVALFTTAGTYTLTCTITDSGGLTVTSAVNVTVNAFSTAAPAAIWNFDEGTGTTTADSSGNHHTGNLSSGVTWGSGVTGGGTDHSIVLNGSSDVNFGTGPSLSGTGGFTLTAWIKTTATTSGVIIQQRDSGFNGEYQLVMNANGTINFFVYGGSYQFGQGGFNTIRSVNDGNWHQIVAIRDGTDGRIYIDGTLAATATGTDASLTSTIGVYIGEDVRNGNNFFNGTIDDARIYPRAIAPAEVTSLYSITGPGVATAAAASPSPVTGNTTALAVLGSSGAGESTLIYSWAATTIPSGAVTPTFSVNGTNAAKNATATFFLSGTYVFTVTITDSNFLTTSSSVSVTVNQTLTSINITPSSAAIHLNQTQAFTGSGVDQFGVAMVSQPTISWTSTGSGSINSSSGVYTGPALPGTATVTATSGSITKNAGVTITNGAPTVATAASGSPSPITGTSTNLSVLGADDGGEANLTYTWITTSKPTGAATPTFSVNSTNAAKNTVVSNLNRAGSYTFNVTITDAYAATTTSAVTLTVTATLTSISVTPANSTVNENQIQAFTATGYDQFGTALVSQPSFTWSLGSGVGSINTATGAYTSPGSTGSATIIATSGSITGSTGVTVANANPTVTTTAAASPSPVTGMTTALSVGATDDGGAANLIYTWTATTVPSGATPVFSANGTLAASASTVTFNKAGAYTFTVTITDGQGGATNSSIGVTVNQTLTSAMVSPASVGLGENQMQTFTATGYDQFGNALISQPTFTWTRTGTGSINSSTGVYTAPSSPGTARVTATSGSITATANVTTANSVPTVVTPASANPSPVTGNSTRLSVLGGDDSGEAGLTYTWVASVVPMGASQPIFSINGTNSAKNSTATFGAAGSYTMTVTISDGQGGTTTSSVGVLVNQTLTSLTVTPSTVGLGENQTQQFAAGGFDQFGNAMASQPVIVWSNTGVGSVNSSTGLYTAPATPGTATITSMSGSVQGSASVTVSNGGPTIVNPAAATPGTVTGTSTALSVLGADDNGESTLTYTWAATTIPGGAASPIFSINANNAAKNTTATFSQAGAYVFTVTIQDAQGGTISSSVNVTVSETLTTLSVAAIDATVITGGSTQVSVTDQFGNVVSPSAITWNVTGGTISSSGLFTAGNSGGNFSISATIGSSSLTTGVSVAPTVYGGATGSNTYAIHIDPNNPAVEQIFINADETDSPTYSVALNLIGSLTFAPSGGDASLTVDFANGNPLPAGGISYTGGSTPTIGVNALVVLGTPLGNMSFNAGATTVIDNAAASSPITYANVQTVDISLEGGSNTLTQTAQPTTDLSYDAGPGNNTLNVNGGSFTTDDNPAITSGSLTINDNADLIFPSAPDASGYYELSLAALNIASGATATVQSADNPSAVHILELSSLSIAATGTLDMCGSDMIVHNGDLAAITAWVGQGYNNGTWTGTGITSQVARLNPAHLTAMAVMSNDSGSGPIRSIFEGQGVGANDILMKYSYYGDATLTGEVSSVSYTRIDNGYLSGATGWANGDFNYDNVVNGSDYTLIDNAFNMQGPVLPLPGPSDEIASRAATPVAFSNVSINSSNDLSIKQDRPKSIAQQLLD